MKSYKQGSKIIVCASSETELENEYIKLIQRAETLGYVAKADQLRSKIPTEKAKIKK